MIRTVFAGVMLLSLMAIVACFCGYSYRIGMGKAPVPIRERKNAISFAIGVILLVAFCYHMASQNQFIYYWDIGEYWTKSYEMTAEIFQHPLQGIRDVWRSVNDSEYNLLLPLFLALPLKLLGNSYASYVTVDTSVFLMPAIFVLISICWKLLDEKKRKPAVFLILLLAAASFSPFYAASFYGYYDAGCLIPASLSVLLAIDYDPAAWDKEQIRRDILIAILLTLSFFLRRYFAYFILGYGEMLVLLSMVMLQRGCGERRKVAICHAIRNLCVVGSTAGILLIGFYHGMLKKMLAADYAQQYMAYDLPLIEKISLVGADFGYFICLMALLALFLSWCNVPFRKMTFFSIGMAGITAISFFHVQAMAPHHIYILCVPIFILFVIGGMSLPYQGKRWKKLGMSVWLFCMLIGVLHSFDIAVQELPAPLSRWYSSFVFQSLVRSDLKELHAMADTLNDMSDQNGTSVYALASGDTLNSGILDSMNKPDQEHAVHRLCVTHDVDLRDGFPKEFLSAGFVVVTDPIDLHLGPGTQEVVRFLAEEIQNPDSPVGRHFVKEGRAFLLDDNIRGPVGSYFVKEKKGSGMRAYIYRKTNDFTNDDLAYIANYFDTRYPGKRDIFGDRILSGVK